MKIQVTKKATLLATAVFLTTSPLTTSITTAAPWQDILPGTSVSSGSSVRLASNSSVSARRAMPRATDTPAAAPARDMKQHDKKTLGRCWKRLMDTIREVRQAHHNKK